METEEAVAYSGVVAVVVTLGGMLLATALSPAFTWRGNALSDLGVTTTAAGTTVTGALFNGGLILGGLLGLVFATAFWRATEGLSDRLVVVLLALTLTLMGLVGVFPAGTTLHVPVALGFYLLATVTLWADAGVALGHGDVRWAALSGVAGTVNALAWVAWGATGAVLRDGLAIPEFVGAVALGTWVILRSHTLAGGMRTK